MTTKFYAGLSRREFGSAVFSVTELHKWLTQKGWHAEILPPLDGYKFIQVEELLCDIERRAIHEITDKDARVIVKTADMETIAGLEERPDMMEDLKHWWHGANAHLQWRERIRQAIEDGELVPRDMGSKLPIPRRENGAKTKAKPEPSATELKSRRDFQVEEIVRQATVLKYPLLAIPYGGKAKIKNACMENVELFSDDAFDHAWKEAKKRKLIEVANVNTYRNPA